MSGNGQQQQAQAVQRQEQARQQYLAQTLQNMKAIRMKMNESLLSLRKLAEIEENNSIIPVTSFLYAECVLDDRNTFLVDVGAGYFVEMDPASADFHMTHKIGQLDQKIREVQSFMQ